MTRDRDRKSSISSPSTAFPCNFSTMMSTQPPISEAVHVRSHRKERQVRNSCNACSSQKIRCGKERPECHRCVEKGRECEYSMSRRTGERPRVVGSPPPPSRAAAGRETAPSTINADHFKSLPEKFVEQTAEEVGDHFSAPDHQDIGWMLDVSPDMAMSLDLNPTTDLTLTMNHNPDVDMVTATSQDFESPIYEYTFDSLLDPTRGHRSPQRSESLQTDPIPSKPESTAHSDLGLLSFPSKKADDCLTEAMHILTYFHVPARGCLTLAHDSTYPMQREHSLEETPREVGTVLSQNGKALRKLGNLLDCRCCLRQEVAVLICLGLHKAIDWYAEILGDDSVPQHDEAQQSLLFGRIAKAPSFMGSYRLDNRAQKLLSAHLVLTQLEEHIEPLMRKLNNLQSAPSSVSSPTSMSTSIMESRSNLIEQHRQSLQEEIDRVVARANSIKQK